MSTNQTTHLHVESERNGDRDRNGTWDRDGEGVLTKRISYLHEKHVDKRERERDQVVKKLNLLNKSQHKSTNWLETREWRDTNDNEAIITTTISTTIQNNKNNNNSHVFFVQQQQQLLFYFTHKKQQQQQTMQMSTLSCFCLLWLEFTIITK